jgi:primase-polymerase (primpol)-like protein
MIRDVYFDIGTYIVFFQSLKREKWEKMNGARENIEVMKNYDIYG